MTQQLTPPAQTIVVRPAALHDAAVLQRVCWPDRSLSAIAEFLQRTRKITMQRRGGAVVAEQAGQPCGFGLLTLWPRAAEISDLIVSPEHRGQGIGSSIIAYLTDTARSLNVGILEIGVALTNPRALALYRRLGFRDYRTIQLDLGSGPETVLYLEKPLRGN